MSRSCLNGASPTHGFVDQSGSAKSSAPALHLNPNRCQNMMKSKSNSITKRVHAQGGVQKKSGKKYIFEEKAEKYLLGLGNLKHLSINISLSSDQSHIRSSKACLMHI